MVEINWSLVDAEAKAAEFDTFRIPPEDERKDIRTGYLCKLIFQLDDWPQDGGPPGERMWVKVTRATQHRYIGKLMNDPGIVAGIQHGDKIEFKPRHIIEIDEE